MVEISTSQTTIKDRVLRLQVILAFVPDKGETKTVRIFFFFFQAAFFKATKLFKRSDNESDSDQSNLKIFYLKMPNIS